MAYKLTPAQIAGINAADAVCKEHGIPLYFDFVNASAMVCVALRDGEPIDRPYLTLRHVLNGLQNETVDK
ncbi:MAG: hypothetical protein ACSLE8_06145 [Rhodococcus sp. (in: high G+C Gram-positive bacteria)]